MKGQVEVGGALRGYQHTPTKQVLRALYGTGVVVQVRFCVCVNVRFW